jgi:hypothetical protein
LNKKEMTVESINNETVIRVPSSIKFDFIQDFIDYLNAKSIISKSQANEKEIDDLAEEAQEQWWNNNKSRFLK